jgi:hypothetical protein
MGFLEVIVILAGRCAGPVLDKEGQRVYGFRR